MKRLPGFVVALATFALTPAARADDMDLELSRLSRSTDASLSDEDACALTLGRDEPLSLRYEEGGKSVQRLAPDNRAFRQVVTQLAPAIAPAVLSPVTTTGPAGFDVAFETVMTGLNASAQYWKRGSEGNGSLAQPTCDGLNRAVASSLLSNRVHFAKGLPLGITVGGTVGKLYDTSLWLVGMDVKLALLEGLRTWPVPDVAVRAAVNTAVGDSQYSLTVISADLILSKNFAAGRVMTISPYGGVGLLWTFATSELVDLTPNIDAVACSAGTDATCNGQVGNAPALGASQDDVGHDTPFKDVSFARYRGLLGLAMRYRLFALAAEFALDLVPPEQADARAGKGTPRQWNLAVAPSLSF